MKIDRRQQSLKGIHYISVKLDGQDVTSRCLGFDLEAGEVYLAIYDQSGRVVVESGRILQETKVGKVEVGLK